MSSEGRNKKPLFRLMLPLLKRLSLLHQDNAARRRGLFLIAISFASCCICITVGVLATSRTHYWSALSYLTALVTISYNAGRYLATGEIVRAANILGVVMYLTMLLAGLLTSGISIPVPYFLALHPICAIILTDLKQGCFWAIAAAVGVVLLHLAPEAGFVHIYTITDAQHVLSKAVSSIMLVVLAATVAYVYEWSRDSVLFELSDNNQRLKVAMKKAAGSNESRTRFLANMSHELRTPMNGIISSLELIEDEALPGPAQELKSLATQSSHSLLELLDDILGLSKVSPDTTVLSHLVLDLQELCLQVTQLYQATAHHKGIKLSISYPRDIPRWFLGDTTRLRQILTTLVGNAIKFTDAGKVSIRIGGESYGAKFHLTADVEDTGQGMSPEELANIFEVLTKVNVSEARYHGGTGIGLALCYRLASLMEGKLEVASTLGKGSVFRLKAPLILAEGYPVTENKGAQQAPASSRTQSSEELSPAQPTAAPEQRD